MCNLLHKQGTIMPTNCVLTSSSAVPPRRATKQPFEWLQGLNQKRRAEGESRREKGSPLPRVRCGEEYPNPALQSSVRGQQRSPCHDEGMEIMSITSTQFPEIGVSNPHCTFKDGLTARTLGSARDQITALQQAEQYTRGDPHAAHGMTIMGVIAVIGVRRQRVHRDGGFTTRNPCQLKSGVKSTW